VPLPAFEHGLLAGHVVAAMAIDEHDALEAVHQKVFDHVADQVDIGARRGRHRAREIEMVGRVAQPHHRGKQDPLGQLALCAARDLAHQHAVGEHRQVFAMLLKRRERQHDGCVFR